MKIYSERAESGKDKDFSELLRASPDSRTTGSSAIRYLIHGNGFLQFKIGKNKRIHVWHPTIPRQKVYTGIHNHRFSFRSTILLGTLEHRIFDVNPNSNGHYQRYRVQGNNLVDDNCRIHVTERDREQIKTGQSYTFAFGDWHETLATTDSLVTLFEKIETVNLPVHVAVPVGHLPDNDFMVRSCPFELSTLPAEIVNCIFPYLCLPYL